MWKRLAIVASTLLILTVIRCTPTPHQVPNDSLKVWLVGLDGKTLLLDQKSAESVPPPPVKADKNGVYYGTRFALSPEQFSRLKQAKNPAVIRVLYGEKDQFLRAEAFPLSQLLKEGNIDLPDAQLILPKAVQIDYQVLDYPTPLTLPMLIQEIDFRKYPWNAYGRLIIRLPHRFVCYFTTTSPCELERCLRYPPEFNFESIEILANAGPAVIKTLTSADCAVTLAASQAFRTAGPSATFKIRATLRRLRAAPASPVYSFRYSSSSLPSRLEASNLVSVDLSSLATLAVGATQTVDFELNWVLPTGIGAKDFFIVNNATYDAIVAKGGCTTPNTMQYYAEDRFRFNLNGAVGGCL
ncbi:hypothetical protein [Larkinella sp.]|uniref:hypothetical protein n=1 Tax=Larkinella sp. TaxID=2034517 RepID=UPI003BA91DED